MKFSRILITFGTRPEAIKMAPLIQELRRHPEFEMKVCVTAQHREMLDHVLQVFDIKPDFDLDLMKPNQQLADLTADVLRGVRDLCRQWRPDLLFVQGDTTTTFAASLAAFYEKIAVAHVEAGLRTHNRFAPWPEEINRRLTTVLAEVHYPPTEAARQNLLADGVPGNSIVVTGNTVIDALLSIVERLKHEPALNASFEKRFAFLGPKRRMILVTGHRRENFGEGFQGICRGLRRLAQRPDVEIVYPVHLNPNVRRPVNEILGGVQNVHLLEPLDYLPFTWLMHRSYLILTDSGGIQEEAPSLAKPTLVMRETTERPEAIEAGTALLVGTDPNKIVAEATRLLDSRHDYEKMARVSNPFGSGDAARRIVDHLLTLRRD
ncbi:MAG TPA: UDP-N-acetylglucosamine 2-epimerase (non-hydrolyzing) [Candidatus Limnocylindrales bacterium]|nr:UDP-N-acetylglucosamine 2-epimerase (non-hydrolyzing) [Candidatus Limnocylindrales bacterium]